MKGVYWQFLKERAVSLRLTQRYTQNKSVKLKFIQKIYHLVKINCFSKSFSTQKSILYACMLILMKRYPTG